MRHRATPSFWQGYRQLPEDVQHLADKDFALLKQHSRHPSLRLKKAGRLWSVRVGSHYRAVAVQQEDDMVWFFIGSHAEYDRLMGRK